MCAKCANQSWVQFSKPACCNVRICGSMGNFGIGRCERCTDMFIAFSIPIFRQRKLAKIYLALCLIIGTGITKIPFLQLARKELCGWLPGLSDGMKKAGQPHGFWMGIWQTEIWVDTKLWGDDVFQFPTASRQPIARQLPKSTNISGWNQKDLIWDPMMSSNLCRPFSYFRVRFWPM